MSSGKRSTSSTLTVTSGAITSNVYSALPHRILTPQFCISATASCPNSTTTGRLRTYVTLYVSTQDRVKILLHVIMLDQSGIESLLPPRVPAQTSTQTSTPPGTVLAGERVVFDSRDNINYNLPTESPEMIQRAVAITPSPMRPIEYTVAPPPPPPPPPSSSSHVLVYVAVLALLICCFMAILYFVSNRGGSKTSNLRNAGQYNMSSMYN